MNNDDTMLDFIPNVEANVVGTSFRGIVSATCDQFVEAFSEPCVEKPVDNKVQNEWWFVDSRGMSISLSDHRLAMIYRVS